jgi:hypothetical protein
MEDPGISAGAQAAPSVRQLITEPVKDVTFLSVSLGRDSAERSRDTTGSLCIDCVYKSVARFIMPQVSKVPWYDATL